MKFLDDGGEERVREGVEAPPAEVSVGVGGEGAEGGEREFR